MATSGWTVLMAAQGNALVEYTGFADFEFLDQLYDHGAATIVLSSLKGNTAPAQGWVVKIVWDYGLASEQIHWQGIIAEVGTKQEGNVYVIRAFTIDYLLKVSQTGGVRHYAGLTPHAIMQAAGTPNPLLVNAQAATVLTYGAAAAVPNKVDATNPGIALSHFVSDSTTLFNNMRRLCLQSQYNSLTGLTADAGSTASILVDAALTQGNDYWVGAKVTMTSGLNAGLSRDVIDFNSATDTLTFASAFPNAIAAGNTYTITIYGLEWATTFEGANLSSPRFYLVKRRERAVTYTPEVFVIPDDFVMCRRGDQQPSGVDSVRVIGGGDGTSRVESSVLGTGTRELVAEDKAIIADTLGLPSTSANATNMANRLLGIYSNGIEMVSAGHYKHAKATRTGDFITARQTGRSDVSLRVMMRHYVLQSKQWFFIIGRPAPIGSDHVQGVVDKQHSDMTTAQFTDLQPTAIEGSNQIESTHGANIVLPIPAGWPPGGWTTLIDSSVDGLVSGTLSEAGKAEGYQVTVEIIQVGGTPATETAHTHTMGNHTHNYDKTDTPTQAANAGNLGVDPHTHDLTYTSTASSGPSTNTTGSTAATVNVEGPIQLIAEFIFAAGTPREIYRSVMWYLPAGFAVQDTRAYIFAARSSVSSTDYTPTAIHLKAKNFGPVALTIGGATRIIVQQLPLHRHNEIT